MIESDAINASIDRARHVLLVVDDNPATRYSTSRVLQKAGFRTLEAGSGQEALDRVGEGVAGLVLDVHLPDINGFDVCRRLRASPATSTLPIVHLSAAFTRDEDRVQGLDAGADAYLVHPVEPAFLVATLQALVRARTAEEELRRSEQRFRAVYDHAPSGIVLLDRGGFIVDANPAMCRLLGLGLHDVVGSRLAELAAPEARALAHQQSTGDDPSSQPWRGQFALLNAAGNRVPLEWSMASHGEPGLRIGIASDATERIQLEAQRRDVLEREQAARAAAERHSRTKDDFIAVLSHELRTPLNAIVGWVNVLMRRSPAPEMVRGLEAIDRSVKSQARIISDILDVSRINSGKLRLLREQVDPAQVVEDALGSVSVALEQRQLRLELALDTAHGTAWLDPARFQQILWNLMTNAIKFSRTGGVIRVALQREPGHLILRVQDFGLGIAPEFMPRLFDRFSQSVAPGQRLHGGLGLGLSIVRQLAELHGGSVTVESAGLGHGAAFEVVLAGVDAPDEPPDSEPGRPGPEDDGTQLLEGLRVLVVEDDQDASEMLSVVLGDRGARVRIAADCPSAVAALREEWPDVLISDIGLPVHDGYELIRRVRAMEHDRTGRPLPALALTAFARAEDRKLALDAGFDEHLPKPLNAHALTHVLQRLRNKARH